MVAKRRQILWRFKRRMAFRRPPGYRRKYAAILCALAAAVFLVRSAIGYFSDEFRPMLTAMATAKVSNEVTLSLSQIVAECLEERPLRYQDILSMEKSADGRIIAVNGDTTALNLLRSDILSRAADGLDRVMECQMEIPVGNLTGIAWLSGKGGGILVEVISVSVLNAGFRHTFRELGINQTWHQILLDLTTRVDILIPGGTITRDVDTQICIADSLIVGLVPEAYLDARAGEG